MKTIFSICLTAGFLCLSLPGWTAGADLKPLSVSQAVIEALKSNPALQEAGAKAAAADEAVNSARADLLPQLSAGYGYTALKEKRVMKNAAGEVQIAHQRQYSWDVTVVQPLFSGFALSSRYDLAKLETAAKTLEKAQAVLDLTRDVRRACYDLLLAQKLLTVSEHEIETLTAHKRDAGLFFSQGLIPPNDQLKAEVALANALQDRERVQAQVCKARIRINRLLNRPLEAPLAIAGEIEVARPSFELAPISAQALKARPLMQLLDIGMQKLGCSEKLARSSWYPQVSFAGSYAQSGDNPGAGNNDFSNSDNSYVAVNARWKFWQSGKTQAEVNRVRRQVKSLEARIESVKNQVLEEVRRAFLDCRVAFNNIGTAEKALAQARENWRLTDLQYQQQVATSTDVLDARAFLTQVDTNYYRAVYGYLDAVAGLERAMGQKAES